MITKDTVVSFKYELFDVKGTLLEKSLAPAVYLHGGYSNVPKRLEEALEGHKIGDKLKVHVEPEDAFGERDETLVRHERREQLPPGNLEVGMRLEAQREDTNDTVTFTITEVDEIGVTLDANHPLAGMSLIFDVEIIDVRPASAAEITQRRAH